jgi:nicotinamide mononucleotide adenylyltransferase
MSVPKTKKYSTLGVIGRFKPLHNGAATMLEALCQSSEHVKIGIGSSNKYNLRNPFTAHESQHMIDVFLSENNSNYSFLFIPDFGHMTQYRDGKRWAEEIFSQYGNLDAFVSSNPYVQNLLSPHYNILHPSELIPKEKWLRMRATTVRIEMARGGDNWKLYMPKAVSVYIESNNLLKRFRQEYGLETLSLASQEYSLSEGSEHEKMHAQER